MTKIGDTFEYRTPRGVQEYDPLERPLWFGLITPPQKERAAREYLKANGVTAFYPDEKRRRVIQGKARNVKAPIISGYVFARFSGRPNWDVIAQRPFFSGVISLYGRPYPIPRADILALMGHRVRAKDRQKALRQHQEALAAARAPVEGEKGRLVDGPFSGTPFELVDVTRVSGGVVSYILPNGLPGTASVGSVERAGEG